MAWYRGKTFIAGIALILVTNAVVLAGVVRNRSGEPDSTLILSNRELSPSHSDGASEEDSGIALRVRARTEPAGDDEPRPWYTLVGSAPPWLDEAKLESLGIHVPERPLRNAGTRTWIESLPMNVYLVLEMNGPSYQRTLDRACGPHAAHEGTSARAETCHEVRNCTTRLFVIDAGRDRKALRAKYPDRTMHAIVRGRIQATRAVDVDGSRVTGRIHGLAIDTIHVPTHLRTSFESVSARSLPCRDPRFEAKIAFGQRLEPWIESLSLAGEP